MVARPLWERKAVGSNPATPTQQPRTRRGQPAADLCRFSSASRDLRFYHPAGVGKVRYPRKRDAACVPVCLPPPQRFRTA